MVLVVEGDKGGAVRLEGVSLGFTTIRAAETTEKQSFLNLNHQTSSNLSL